MNWASAPTFPNLPAVRDQETEIRRCLAVQGDDLDPPIWNESGYEILRSLEHCCAHVPGTER